MVYSQESEIDVHLCHLDPGHRAGHFGESSCDASFVSTLVSDVIGLLVLGSE